jgi:hypothetical protein
VQGLAWVGFLLADGSRSIGEQDRRKKKAREKESRDGGAEAEEARRGRARCLGCC